MKHESGRLPVRALALLLTAALLAVSLGFAGCQERKPSEEIKICVLPKSMQISFWKVVIAGVNIATSEYKVDVEIHAPSSEEDYRTQIELVEQAIAGGCDAIVISAIDYSELAPVIEKAIASGIEVISIDSEVNTPKVKVRISTDNYRAGQRLAEHLIRNINYKGVMGVVGLRGLAQNGIERQQGIIDTVARYPDIELREIISVDSNIYAAKEGTREMLKRNPDITAVVAVNEQTTIGMGYALIEAEKNILAVGFDNATASMNMLEDKVFDAVIVQNQYAMGYLGIEYAVKAVQGIAKEEVDVDTGITVVTRDNMFVNDMQTLIFPFG